VSKDDDNVYLSPSLVPVVAREIRGVGDTFRHRCPECGAEVEARHPPSSDGIGVIPWEVEVRRGSEHEKGCRNYLPPEKMG